MEDRKPEPLSDALEPLEDLGRTDTEPPLGVRLRRRPPKRERKYPVERPKPLAEDYESAREAIGQSLAAMGLPRSARKRLLKATAHEAARQRVARERQKPRPLEDVD